MEEELAFTAHNIRLPDGSRTAPDIGWLIAESPWMAAAAKVLDLVYPRGVNGESIVDLGCLEGGYTAEFARMGMRATGIEVRQSNFENCELVRSKLQIPDLSFIRDDVWNLARYGQFSAAFCCGLLYHLDRPAEFIRLMSAQTRDVVMINTHFATERESKIHNLSPLTEHEGLQGRWYAEHDTDDKAELETYKWTSWSNKKSFWLTKPSLFQTLQACGFDLLFEQADFLGPDLGESMSSGYYAAHDRGMFVGIRTRAR